MKKIFAVLMCLTMLLAVSACAGTPDPKPAEDDTAKEEIANMVNPVRECESLDEINEAVGCKLQHPGVMGVTDERYCVIEGTEFDIAEYDFTVNGYPCCFRASGVVDQDICGYYMDGDTAFSGEPDYEIVTYAASPDVKLARWFSIDGQYTFALQDAGEMEQATFEGIVEELTELTVPGLNKFELAAIYEDLAGTYFDSTSQRATAEVTASEGGVTIVVDWASSAFETNEWTMNAYVSEDGLLSYSDETLVTIGADEAGEETRTEQYTDAAGYFEMSENTLLWTGAADENCRACVFEKAQ